MPERRHPHHTLRWLVNRVMRRFAGSKVVNFSRLIAGIMAVVATLTLATIKAIDSYKLQDSPFWKVFYNNKEGIILFLIVVQIISQAAIGLVKALRFRLLAVDRIEKVLGALVVNFFGSPADHEYRATLFKKRRFFLLGTWLGVVARSGENFRRMRSIFSFNENDRSECTGFAGQCFFRDKVLSKYLDPISENATEEQAVEELEYYKTQTFLADCEYDSLTLRSRCFFAVCIKLDGKKWGVLVLDSTDPNMKETQNNRKTRKASLEFAAIALSALIQ